MGSPGVYQAGMYHISPLIVNDVNNLNYITPVTSDIYPAKKKLVIIFGWSPKDKSDVVIPYPGIDDLKTRITQNWASFFSNTDLTVSKITSTSPPGLGYEIYAYNYLTSDAIDVNGTRFRAKMDALFSGQTGTVVIFAHSMGGLVSRFASYEGGRPSYLKKIITSGTPHHGSPWASPEFQDTTSLGEIASFLINTAGGQDLRWDNFDGALAGASNPKLSSLNQKTDRDDLLHTFYGSYTYTGSLLTPVNNKTLIIGCNVMNKKSASFNPSDCIVPSSSATISGHTLTAAAEAFINHDHVDMKLSTNEVRTALYNYLAALPW